MSGKRPSVAVAYIAVVSLLMLAGLFLARRLVSPPVQMAFARSVGEGFDIYVVEAPGSEPRQLTDYPGFDSDPTWAPDGRSLAYVSWVDGNYEIFRLDVKTGRTMRITHNDAWDSWPSWSPRGQQLAYASDESGNFEIYLLGPKGEKRRLTNHPGFDGHPA